ncbi:MAG: hypothetical protein K2L54_00780 [Clostridiales bacterium]|nr:hypothetical protein [Clostridiales bacterium]
MKFAEHLKNAAERDKLRFHTPGHKGGLCAFDLTELSDGSFPNAAVLEAETRIATHYKAAHARMLCGGSSQGVKSAIYATCENGVADVNSHRAVFDGFRLAGKTVTAVGRRGDVTPITLEEIKRGLKPTDGAVIVTSPTYYGYCADVDGIAEFCRSRGLTFIIDGAHGAHFGASELLPPTFADKCDVCNVSAHKTLSALTQSAILLDNLDGARRAALDEAVEIMGTTSPSYLLYSSIDAAVERLASAQARYAALYDPIESLKSEYPFLKNDDFTRLVLDCTAIGAGAERLNNALCRRGVYSEMTDGRHIVFIITADDGPQDIEKLRGAIKAAIAEII